jgi:putative redox protein
MVTKVNVKWTGDLSFEANVNGFPLKLDTSVDEGGTDLGPRPKPLLLAALSACSGMDVVSMLTKMRIKDYQLSMEMEGDAGDIHPKIFNTIKMKFVFTGNNLPADKVIHTVGLSIDKYCAVYGMLKEAATIKTSIIINNEEIWHD